MAVNALPPSATERLRERLTGMRAELAAEIRARLSEFGEPGQVSVQAHLGQADDASGADIISDDELLLLDHERTELAAIDTALARLDFGVANVCLICGGEIPFERLLANPMAQTDVVCQERIESGELEPP